MTNRDENAAKRVIQKLSERPMLASEFTPMERRQLIVLERQNKIWCHSVTYLWRLREES